LDRARRILPEWEGLDNEIQSFSKRLKKKNFENIKDEL
jgi:hypothetical protein